MEVQKVSKGRLKCEYPDIIKIIEEEANQEIKR